MTLNRLSLFMCLLSVLCVTNIAQAAYPLAADKTWVDDEVLTHTDLNNEFNKGYNTGLDPANINDASGNSTEHDATADPATGLPTSLEEEIQELRWTAKQALGGSKWHSYTELTTITTSATLSLDNSNYVVSSANAQTVTLPAATLDKVFYIKNKGTAAVTVDGNGSETIDGSTTHTLNGKNDFIQIISDGSNWHIKAKNYSGDVSVHQDLYCSAVYSGGVAQIRADYLTVSTAADQSGHTILLNTIVESTNINSTGAHGLDNGTLASNTKYFVYVIHNLATADTDTLISTSQPTPQSLPSGYSYYRLVSLIRTSAHTASPKILSFSQQTEFYMYDQVDNDAGGNYSTQVLDNTTLDSATWVVVDASGFIPEGLTRKAYINFYFRADNVPSTIEGARYKIDNTDASIIGTMFTFTKDQLEPDSGFFWINMYDTNIGRFYIKSEKGEDSDLRLAVAGFMLRL